MTSLAMAAEAPLQLLQRQADHGGPAMYIVVRQIRGEQALEQLLHLDRREPLTGLDGGLARERLRHPLVLRARRTRQLAARTQLGDHLARAALRVEVRMRR